MYDPEMYEIGKSGLKKHAAGEKHRAFIQHGQQTFSSTTTLDGSNYLVRQPEAQQNKQTAPIFPIILYVARNGRYLPGEI